MAKCLEWAGHSFIGVFCVDNGNSLNGSRILHFEFFGYLYDLTPSNNHVNEEYYASPRPHRLKNAGWIVSLDHDVLDMPRLSACPLVD
jgi:hypothetical protein